MPCHGCADLLSHTLADIRWRAARNIGDISAPLRGKHEGVALGTVPRLVPLLRDPVAAVRAAAAFALMTFVFPTCMRATPLAASGELTGTLTLTLLSRIALSFHLAQHEGEVLSCFSNADLRVHAWAGLL